MKKILIMISVPEKIALLVMPEQETESDQRGEKVKRKKYCIIAKTMYNSKYKFFQCLILCNSYKYGGPNALFKDMDT